MKFCKLCSIGPLNKLKYFCLNCKNIRIVQNRKKGKQTLKATYPEKYKLQRKLQKKRYYKKNPDKLKADKHLYKARRRNAEGKFTGQEWTEVKLKQNDICLICKEVKKLTIDHIIPLSKGGSNYISNIQGLCFECNSNKRDFLMEEL